jgi:NitT/TauT family transport system substrate-binding protein
MIRALLLAACLVTPAMADEPPLWRDGVVSGSGDSGVANTPVKQGFDRAHGIRMEMVPLKGDPLLLKALIAGQLESYEGGLSSPLIAASKGADIKIIACPGQKQNYTLWARPPVTTLAGLTGHLVGISTPGSAPDNFIHAALEGQNIPVAGVKFVAIGTPPELLRSMGAGIIDAAAVTNELDGRAAAAGFVKLTTSDEATPLAMRRCLYTTGAILQARRRDVVGFLAAEIQAYHYVLAHRDETIALTRETNHAKPDAEEPAAAYDDIVTRKTVDPDLSIPGAKLQWQADALIKTGQIPVTFNVATIVDPGPLEEALKQGK